MENKSDKVITSPTSDTEHKTGKVELLKRPRNIIEKTINRLREMTIKKGKI